MSSRRELLVARSVGLIAFVVKHVPQVEVGLGEIAPRVIDQLQLFPFGDADAVVAKFEYLGAGQTGEQRRMGCSDDLAAVLGDVAHRPD